MNKIILFITLFSLSGWVMGQTPSNDCSTAAGQQIALGGCVTADWNGNGVSPTQTACGGSGAGGLKEKWVWFQANGSTTTINLDNTTTNRDLKIYIYENSASNCGTATYLTCSNLGGNGVDESVSFATTNNYYYFVQIVANGNSSNGTLCVVTPPANDNCAGAVALTAPSGSCVSTAGTTAGATLSQAASASCATTNPDDDVWFTFNAPAAGSYVVQVDGAASFDAVVEVFGTACGSASLGCQNATGNDGVEALNVTVPSSGIYRVRVYHNGTGSSATPTFNICVITPPVNDNCAFAIAIPTNNCGAPLAGTSLNATQSQSGCSGTADDDVWYTFTSSATGYAQLSVAGNAGSDPVLQIFSGTCGSLISVQCVNTSAGTTETATLTGLAASTTYYVRVYHSGTGSGGNTFTICNSTVVTCPTNLGDVTVGGALPYTQTSTTCGNGNNLTSANVTNYCGSTSYYNGEDVVYNFTPGTSGNVTVTLTSGGTWTGLMVHEGCPTAGGSCVGSSQSSSGNKTVTLCVQAGTTYYVVVDSYPLPNCNPFTINISAPSGGGATATNDNPCNATALTLGVSAGGDNACTGFTNEPASVPACWSSGARNTVWYSVTAPASGQLKIRTLPTNSGNPLQNTQIAVYTGTCGTSLTFVACNDNAPACGGYTQYISDLSLTGLNPGQTYYIVVDGNANSVGSFEIVAIDGLTAFAPVPGQDCSQSLPVCNATMTIGNPGFQSIGSTCDHPGTNNCTSGEANSAWYSFTMSTDGDLLFNIVPNDYGNPNPITGQVNSGFISSGDETDYDWVLWKISGAGATNCASISSSGGDGEIACNFSFLGVTGTSIDGNGPAPYGTGYNASYEVAPFALAGETYLLVIQNFSNSTSGFTIEFTSSPISYTTTGTLYWTAGANTSEYTTNNNWGGCGTPDCARDAVILSSSTYQPTLTTGTYNVRDITINPGASLTIQSGVTLNVCGNFTNNGNLICQPGSIVNFVGTGLQNLTGSFVGADAFHHFTVTKASGSVFLNNDITINGDFTTVNATSILNTNQKYIRLAGDFDNFDGNTTYFNTGSAGTLDFIGNGNQFYDQGTSQLDLNFVIMNSTAALGDAVDLLTNMHIKATTGTLTLNTGTITTNANRVDVANSAVGSVSVGNTASFVDGNLRRSTLGTGTYNWAVGNVAKGYQRALTTFASNANPYIEARFDSWPGGLPIQGGSDCATTFSMDAMDNGYWTLAGDGSAATYNMSLFPLNVTNAAAGWTIMKQANYALTGWTLNGVCAASTAAQVNRNSMTNFSVFGIAQSPTPLPIELLYFDGEIVGEDNLLTWATVSEQNNDYFTLERSRNGFDFEVLGTVAGAGTSTSTLYYNQFDYDPFAGISYYRLKQTDFDGQYIYSQTIALNREMEQAVVSDLFPNPANNSVNFMLNTPKTGTVNVDMFDNTGRLIATQAYEAHIGSNSFTIDISQFARGVYSTIIRFEHLEKEEIKQLIKQ